MNNTREMLKMDVKYEFRNLRLAILASFFAILKIFGITLFLVVKFFKES
jgi:hypothetical protein